MVSPELLRRFPFFAFLGEAQLRAVAMLAEEITVEKDETIFDTGQPADALCFLIEGCVDLYYSVIDEIVAELRKDFFISEINPGEPFGISALIEPYLYTGMVRATCSSRVLRFDASGLRALCEVDAKLSASLMTAMAKAAMERLNDTRIQLVAARA